MSAPRPPSPTSHGWQRTQAGGLPLPPVAPTPPRMQPPLREVLKGLDSRELEGETVFDELFGKLDGNLDTGDTGQARRR